MSADHAATVRHALRYALPTLTPAALAALDALEADLAAYQRSLMAHHEISTLSQAAIAESIGGACQICARAQAEADR